ncbi:MAG: sugar phosphate isomerase/epimerase [Planctomycetes bacterium]|nr:sugar phosphate isomerase/epimerase [Planctomycetota bacterium]
MQLNRRELLAAGGLVAAASTLGETAEPAGTKTSHWPIRYCLNTSTIRRSDREDLPLVEKIDIAAQAGYDGIEPWIREIETHVSGGGTTADLARRIADAGLSVESAIGFSQWIVDDDQQRRAALEQAKREMELVRAIGGTRIAAPPSGATREPLGELQKAAERYGTLLEIGESVGVVPQLELWGFSTTLSRLGELAYVAAECGRHDACVLPDVYHIYKGGSDFAGLAVLNGRAIHVFHMNDYPANPSRAEIGDAHRVYPGDGVAPLSEILKTLRTSGFAGALSLELFNRDYWRQDPLEVARTGLAKMRAAATAA